MALFDLSAKVSLVTGAGSGLGRTFARALASQGAYVICVDREMSRAEETAAMIEQAGGRCIPMKVDVSEEKAVSAMAEQVKGTHKRLHILFNNAGITSVPMRTHEVSIEEWHRVMSINLTGVFLCTRALIPLMLDGLGGSIINIASVAGVVGLYPGFPAAVVSYVASKAGVIGLTRQVAVEYAKDQIRANVIAPGFHAGTRLGEVRRTAATPEERAAFEKMVVAVTPMGRMGRLDELEGLAIYLASDASSFVTGQVFAHDGGMSAA